MNPPSVVINTPAEGREYSFTGSLDITVRYTGTAGDDPILFYIIQIAHESWQYLSFCSPMDSSGGDVKWQIRAAGEFTSGTHIVRVIAVDDEGFGGISADRTITITDDS